MNTFFWAALSLCLAVALSAPPRPDVSETFEATFSLATQDKIGNSIYQNFGSGAEASIVTKNDDGSSTRSTIEAQGNSYSGIEWVVYEDVQPAPKTKGSKSNSNTTVYSFNSKNLTACQKSTLPGPLPLHWAWLANSTYTGQTAYQGQLLNWWNSTVVYFGASYNVSAAFINSNNITATPTIPVICVKERNYQGNSERSTTTYRSFIPEIANPSIFNLPTPCTALP
eukprot:Phypoly_transcript_19172.p1 GENE.Phypoly_transcript_19172~~Phypoly_transcript_19172.p1  ORF type:complete len:226 (+),score=41.64 Phypoly_transcript_19172:38-715(+)